jgi:hypothetical protein
MVKQQENTETKVRTSLDFFGLNTGNTNPEKRFVADTSVTQLHLGSNSAEIHINSTQSALQTKSPVPSAFEDMVIEPQSKEHNPSIADILFDEHKLADKITEPLTQIAPDGMGEAEACQAISKPKSFDLLSDGCEPSHSESPMVSQQPPVNQWEKTPTSLQEFVDRFVFIEKGSKVTDLHAPSHLAIMSMKDFNNKYSNVIFLDGKKKVTAPKLWKASPERQDAHYESYLPGDPRLCKNEYGMPIINTYQGAIFDPVYKVDEAQIQVCFDHIKYLIPQNERFELMLDWMAYSLQHPGKRIKFTPFLVSKEHGTGRGWLSEVIQKLLGTHNVKKVKIDELAGRGGGPKYQNYLEGSVCCIVDEVKEDGGKRFEVNDKIRDLLTDDYLPVNLKYGLNGTIKVFTNLFFIGNGDDEKPLLIIPKEDRRLWVLETTVKPMDQSYYIDLYQWLDGEGLKHLYWWLMGRDLSGFNRGQRAPMTPEKQRMISSGQSDLAESFGIVMHELKNGEGGYQGIEVATPLQVRELMKDIAGYDVGTKEEGPLGRLLSNTATQWIGPKGQKIIKWGGNAVRSWILFNAEKWSGKEPVDLRCALDETAKICKNGSV